MLRNRIGLFVPLALFAVFFTQNVGQGIYASGTNLSAQLVEENSCSTKAVGSSTTRSSEEINWQVLSSGGENTGTTENYRLSNTVGQTAAGWGSSETYGINHGFWQNFSIGGVFCVPGDPDESGAVDIDDVVYEIAYIFTGGPPPMPEICCGDADGSGAVDIDDVVYLIAYIFIGGPAPVAAC